MAGENIPVVDRGGLGRILLRKPGATLEIVEFLDPPERTRDKGREKPIKGISHSGRLGRCCRKGRRIAPNPQFPCPLRFLWRMIPSQGTNVAKKRNPFLRGGSQIHGYEVITGPWFPGDGV